MSEYQQFLTLDEICFKLRCSESQVLKLIREEKLVGIQLPRGGGRRQRDLAYLRILWPPDHILEYIQQTLHPVDYFPLLTMPEAAEIMGITMNTIRSYIYDGLLKVTKRGKYSFIAPMEVRRYLYYAERRRRKNWGSKSIKILQIVRWFRSVYMGNTENEADPTEELLNEAMRLPEPERTVELMKVFDLVDLVATVAAPSAACSAEVPPARGTSARRDSRE